MNVRPLDVCRLYLTFALQTLALVKPALFELRLQSLNGASFLVQSGLFYFATCNIAKMHYLCCNCQLKHDSSLGLYGPCLLDHTRIDGSIHANLARALHPHGLFYCSETLCRPLCRLIGLLWLAKVESARAHSGVKLLCAFIFAIIQNIVKYFWIIAHKSAIFAWFLKSKSNGWNFKCLHF